MKVAVPPLKHSPILGQEASSQTVCSLLSRRICLISWKRALSGTFMRIHSGFRMAGCGTILIGMRAVLAAPVSLRPATLAAGRLAVVSMISLMEGVGWCIGCQYKPDRGTG